jgi:Tol biopolymer transport system component
VSRAVIAAVALVVTAAEVQPALSRRGDGVANPPARLVAFVRYHEFDDEEPGAWVHTEVMLVELSSGAERPVGTATDTDSGGPVWSPRGRYLAYVSGEHVYVLDVRSGKQRRLTPPGYNDSPSWAPDGRRLAYAGGANARNLFVVNLDGSHRRRIARFAAQIDGISWGPTGDQVLVEVGPFDTALHLVDVRSRSRRRLTPSGFSAHDAKWAPDGKRILFWGSSPKAQGLFLTTPTDRAPRRISFGSDAAWSPDASRIAFNDSGRVYVMRHDQKGRRQIGKGGEPAWSPDGRHLAYGCAEENNIHPICVSAPDGRGRRAVTRPTSLSEFEFVEDGEPAWQPFPAGGPSDAADRPTPRAHARGIREKP